MSGNRGDGLDEKPSKLPGRIREGLRRVGRKSLDATRAGLETSGELLSKAGEETADLRHRTVEQAGSIARTSIGRVKEGLGDAAERAQSAAAALLGKAQESTEFLRSKVFRETTVPVLLLPTGSGASDFYITYSFEQALDSLSSGAFVQPVLEIWAARPDVDRGRLVESLHATFLRDFQKQKEVARKRHGLENIGTVVAAREAQAKQEESGKEVQSAAGWVGVGLVGMFLTWNPLFDLLFLTLAVYKGATGITKILEYMGHGVREAGIEAELAKSRKELSKLESELDSKNQVFREAVLNLEIKVHPQLQDLLVDMSAVDMVPYVPVEAGSGAPPVQQGYQLMDYFWSLPDWGRPLLAAHRQLAASRAD